LTLYASSSRNFSLFRSHLSSSVKTAPSNNLRHHTIYAPCSQYLCRLDTISCTSLTNTGSDP